MAYDEDPLSGYVNRHLGHPLVQTSGSLDSEIAAEAEELMGLGFAPTAAARLAAKKIAMRRQRGGGGYRPRCVGADEMLGVFGLGGDDDDDFTSDLGDIDDMISGMEDDDETIGLDDDTNVGLGASISKTEQKIAEISAHIQKLETRKGTVRGPRKKALQMRIDRLKRVKSRKEAKLNTKRAKLAAKLGIPVAALAAGAGVGATAAALTAAGIPPQQAAQVEAAMARASGNSVFGSGQYKTVPPEGDLVPVPILFAGANVLNIAVAAGAGLRTAPVTGTSLSIAYADFEVLGLLIKMDVQQELSGGGFPLGEAVTNLLLDSLIVAGGINQFYGTIDALAAADLVSTGMVNGAQRYSNRLSGFRDNPRLDKTNTATILGTFRQEITTSEPINVTIQMSLICRRLNDSAAQRSI